MSAPIRELVTRLSFRFDRTNLDRFERAITGFRARFLIAAGVVGALVKKTIDFVAELADAAVQTKDIADYSGESVTNLKAMQLAASKFAIPENTFGNFFKELSTARKQLEFGEPSFLRDLARESKGLFNILNINNQIKSTKELFLELAKAVKEVGDRGNQLRILEQIPGIGAENAGKFLRFLELSNDEIIKLIDNETEAASKAEKLAQNGAKFQVELAKLNTEFSQLVYSLGSIVIPELNKSFSGLNTIIEKGKEGGFLAAVDFVGEAIADAVQSTLGLDTLSNAMKRENGEEVLGVLGYAKNFFRAADERVMQRVQERNDTNNVSNNINLNVPPGTPQNQVEWMGEALRQTMNDFYFEKNREVINNNPTVE
jgi:hypothetical protein